MHHYQINWPLINSDQHSDESSITLMMDRPYSIAYQNYGGLIKFPSVITVIRCDKRAIHS